MFRTRNQGYKIVFMLNYKLLSQCEKILYKYPVTKETFSLDQTNYYSSV